ncbi:MAG: ComEC family competence protein [Prevotella sp.]|nr:ComEC family competence protein [Prevotella sp.]
MKTNNWLQLVPLVRIAIFLMAGIVVADLMNLSVLWWMMFSVCSLLLSFFASRNAVMQSVFLLVSFFFLGGLLLQHKKDLTIVVLPQEEIPFEAVVLSEPVVKNKVVVCDLLITNFGKPLKVKASIWKDSRSLSLRPGEGIAAYAVLKPPSNAGFSSFDYRTYLLRHGFHAVAFVYADSWNRQMVSLKSLSLARRTQISALAYRHRLLERYHEYGIKEQQFAVVAAMTLGDKSQLSQETKDLFSQSGASHILALSGLHLSIVYGLLSMLYRGRRFRFLHEILILLSIWSYTMMVGMSSSVVRSATMLSIYSLFSLQHRDKMSVNVLAFAAIVMLIVSPMDIYDVGFQLSFASVFSILLFFRYVYRLLPDIRQVIFRKIWQMGALSISAQIGTIPLVAYYFGFIPCYSVLTSFVVIPSAVVIIYTAFAMILLGSCGLLAQIAAAVITAMSDFVHLALECISRFPGATIQNISLSAVQVWMIYVIIFALYVMIRRYLFVNQEDFY